MMESLGNWLMSLVAVSLLTALAQSLAGSGGLRRAANFTGGLVLLAALLQPLPGLDWEELLPDKEAYQAQVESLQGDIEQTQAKELAAGIEERTASYISDKARCAVRVETKMVDGLPLPWWAELDRGYDAELSAWMMETVGIPKERQEWHGAEN